MPFWQLHKMCFQEPTEVLTKILFSRKLFIYSSQGFFSLIERMFVIVCAHGGNKVVWYICT